MQNTEQEETIQRKTFWTRARFLIANGIVLFLLLIGFQVTGVSAITGTLGGFAVSSVLLWYILVSLLWWFALAGFSTHELKRKKVYRRYPYGVVISAWVFTLIPAWLLFLIGLRLYVIVNKTLS